MRSSCGSCQRTPGAVRFAALWGSRPRLPPGFRPARLVAAIPPCSASPRPARSPQFLRPASEAAWEAAAGRGPAPQNQTHNLYFANIARCINALLILGCTMPALWAQNLPAPAPRGGLQLRSISAYFDYYSASLPNGGFQSSANLLSDFAGGTSVHVGWIQSSERSTSSFGYISSLTGRVRYSEWNAWNHGLSLTTSRKVGYRWTFGFSVSGDLSSQQQSLFSPTVLGTIASTPATFDDLASAMLASKFSNPQLASALTRAPLVESPVRNLLYGQRMLTSGAQTSLTYSYSPRLSLSFQAGAGRSQHVTEGRLGTSRSDFLIPNTTSGSAGLTVSYSLSPQTQLSGIVTANRISSSQQDAYITTSLVSLGWTFGKRWLAEIRGGAGIANPIRQSGFLQPANPGPQPVGGARLGFKTFSHIFLGSFDRTVSDSYGLGAATTSSAGLTWRWKRPGREWWLESSAGWQQLAGNGLGNTSGWRAMAGLGRNIGTHIVLLTQYAYLNYSGRLQTTPYSQDQSALRVSLVWSPHPEMSQ